MASNAEEIKKIQSLWEIPNIAYHCTLFAADLADFPKKVNVEDLEAAFLSNGTEDQIRLIPELIIHLLNCCIKNGYLYGKIDRNNYHKFLYRFLRRQNSSNIEDHIDEDTNFQTLPVSTQVKILYDLCHFRLHLKDMEKMLKCFKANNLRIEPLGYDSNKFAYWYFNDTRLYREGTQSVPYSLSSEISQHKIIWQVICVTLYDWQKLANQFGSSLNAKEVELSKVLIENLLPKLPTLFKERQYLKSKNQTSTRMSSRIAELKKHK